MGLTRVRAKISNLSKSKKGYEALFLVDTGALDCMAPAKQLDKSGIKAEGKDVYELANGQSVEYKYGFARIYFMGTETVGRIVFGPEDIEPILGVDVLESAGFTVDPVSKELKKMSARPLK